MFAFFHLSDASSYTGKGYPMKELKLNLTLIALYYHQVLMRDLFENHQSHVLVLDEKKARLLASVILSGVYDEEIAEEVLGIPLSLFRQIRKHFIN